MVFKILPLLILFIFEKLNKQHSFYTVVSLCKFDREGSHFAALPTSSSFNLNWGMQNRAAEHWCSPATVCESPPFYSKLSHMEKEEDKSEMGKKQGQEDREPDEIEHGEQGSQPHKPEAAMLNPHCGLTKVQGANQSARAQTITWRAGSEGTHTHSELYLSVAIIAISREYATIRPNNIRAHLSADTTWHAYVQRQREAMPAQAAAGVWRRFPLTVVRWGERRPALHTQHNETGHLHYMEGTQRAKWSCMGTENEREDKKRKERV